MDTARTLSRTPITRRRLFGLAVGGSMMLACSVMTAPAMAVDKFLINCRAATPSANTSHYPGADRMILSNNLARPTGKALDADGQLLYLSGRITDENCVPVINAIIDLWQANPYGQYRMAARDELLNPEPVFAGNGRAVTDNMGHYRFITLFPGASGRNAPHINLRVSHPDFHNLNTTMYFRGDRRNETDPRLRAFRAPQQELLLGDITPRNPDNLQAGLDVRFDIVLKGSNPFRGY